MRGFADDFPRVSEDACDHQAGGFKARVSVTQLPLPTLLLDFFAVDDLAFLVFFLHFAKDAVVDFHKDDAEFMFELCSEPILAHINQAIENAGLAEEHEHRALETLQIGAPRIGATCPRVAYLEEVSDQGHH